MADTRIIAADAFVGKSESIANVPIGFQMTDTRQIPQDQVELPDGYPTVRLLFNLNSPIQQDETFGALMDQLGIINVDLWTRYGDREYMIRAQTERAALHALCLVMNFGSVSDLKFEHRGRAVFEANVKLIVQEIRRCP